MTTVLTNRAFPDRVAHLTDVEGPVVGFALNGSSNQHVWCYHNVYNCYLHVYDSGGHPSALILELFL